MSKAAPDGSPEPACFLRELFDAGVTAALPEQVLPPHWPPAPAGRIGVIALGKAAVPMAALAAAHYGPALSGLVIHPPLAAGALPDLPGFRCLPGSHPVPAANSVVAARAALAFAARLGRKDLLLVLLSGGGSALACLPVPGLPLAAKQRLTRQLLACGAAIGEINCLRKHLSGIKGGRLAAASRAPVVTLAISDVPGDDPALIASGPTVEDFTTLADARAVLTAHNLEPEQAVSDALADPANESPAFGPGRQADRVEVVAGGMTALDAAAALCRERGIEPRILGDDLEGEAAQMAAGHARLARELAQLGQRCCLLSGGEATVRLGPSPGRGGPSTEYALALAVALRGDPRILAIAADTDGIDGRGGHAGAIVRPGTLDDARARGLDPAGLLAANDSARLFETTGDLLVCGPTGTNVNDFRAILLNPST